MPQGDKSKYTDRQKRQAAHIEEGYEKKGIFEAKAEARAWATANKNDGGGKQPDGSGRKKADKSFLGASHHPKWLSFGFARRRTDIAGR